MAKPLPERNLDGLRGANVLTSSERRDAISHLIGERSPREAFASRECLEECQRLLVWYVNERSDLFGGKHETGAVAPPLRDEFSRARRSKHLVE